MPTPPQGYFNAAGERIPGTTTIIGRFKESGALVHWAWKLGMEGKDYREVRAADAGTAAHAMMEAPYPQAAVRPYTVPAGHPG